MKIFEWNIGMAATIPSNQGYNLLPWIIDEIIKEEPDGIILTEFVVSKGIDYYIRELEENNYHWFISSNTKSNGILIALKSTSFIFKDTFNHKINEEIKKLNENRTKDGEYCATFAGQNIKFDGEKFNGTELTNL